MSSPRSRFALAAACAVVAVTALVAGALGAAAAGCLGVEYRKVDADAGAGAAGGAGGSAGDCAAFTLDAPDDCDAALLSDPDNCCVAGRSCQGGVCDQGSCGARLLAESLDNGEAIGVVLLGSQVLWSTGAEGSILAVGKNGGAVSVVAEDPSFTTELATDGERVFWVEYDGPDVRSVDPDLGPPSVAVVGTVTGARGGWGRIAVRGDWVVWTTGMDVPGVWAAPKNGAAPAPVTIWAEGTPHGVALDDEHVYWTDNGDVTPGVWRRAFAEGAPGGDPEPIGPQNSYLTAVAVVAGRAYWIDGGTVHAWPTGGGSIATLGTSESGWELAFDDKHVYWTSETNDTVYRARLSGGQQTTAIATGDHPKGIAVDCDTVYFTNFTDSDPDSVSKVAK